MTNINVELCVANFRSVLNAERMVNRRKKNLEKTLPMLTKTELAEYVEITNKMTEERGLNE